MTLLANTTLLLLIYDFWEIVVWLEMATFLSILVLHLDHLFLCEALICTIL